VVAPVVVAAEAVVPVVAATEVVAPVVAAPEAAAPEVAAEAEVAAAPEVAAEAEAAVPAAAVALAVVAAPEVAAALAVAVVLAEAVVLAVVEAAEARASLLPATKSLLPRRTSHPPHAQRRPRREGTWENSPALVAKNIETSSGSQSSGVSVPHRRPSMRPEVIQPFAQPVRPD
jgi:hypothetical protein